MFQCLSTTPLNNRLWARITPLRTAKSSHQSHYIEETLTSPPLPCGQPITSRYCTTLLSLPPLVSTLLSTLYSGLSHSLNPYCLSRPLLSPRHDYQSHRPDGCIHASHTTDIRSLRDMEGRFLNFPMFLPSLAKKEEPCRIGEVMVLPLHHHQIALIIPYRMMYHSSYCYFPS